VNWLCIVCSAQPLAMSRSGLMNVAWIGSLHP
jgi:hypothetical protein